MDVYIKPLKKVTLTGRKAVYLKDIAEIYAGEKNEQLKNIIVLEIKSDERRNYTVSIIDIIKSISNQIPDCTVVNVGEMDVLVEYDQKKAKENKLLLFLKIAFVVVVLFFGAATAIMSFHSDGEIPQIMEGYYYMFFHEVVNIPYVLEIPYSIGLGVGIIVFFNHFSKFHITKDPTPIEVQMTTYEQETIVSIVEGLERQKDHKEQ